MGDCAGITKSGERCKAPTLKHSSYCFFHDPDPEVTEARDEKTIRGGRTAGRMRPITELHNTKWRLSKLADDVLQGEVERATGSVVAQVLGVLVRCCEIEARVREQNEVTARIDELEALLNGKNKTPWHSGFPRRPS